MAENRFDMSIWPILQQELSRNKVNYSIDPTCYPADRRWAEIAYSSIMIMLEDTPRRLTPGSNVPWECYIHIIKSKRDYFITLNLHVYIARDIDIKHILAIMDNPEFTQSPSLLFETLTSDNSHYGLSIRTYFGHDYPARLPEKIKLLASIIDTIYKIEKAPNEKLLEALTELLVKFQIVKIEKK